MSAEHPSTYWSFFALQIKDNSVGTSPKSEMREERPLAIAGVTQGHGAYSRFYLPRLRGPWKGSEEVCMERFHYPDRDMCDDDLRQVVDAMNESINNYHAENCSFRGLESIDISGNSMISTDGLCSFVDSLSEIVKTCTSCGEWCCLKEVNFSNLTCVPSLELTSCMVRLIRTCPSLEKLHLMAFPPDFASEEREREEDSRVRPFGQHNYYTALEIEMNAELNGLPKHLKESILRIGKSEVGYTRVDLAGVSTKEHALTPRALMFLGRTLRKNRTVKFLDLSRNQISDEGISEFAPVLGSNSSIVELVLNNNCIGTVGGMALTAAIGNGQNNTLIELSLQGNSICDPVVNKLIEIVKSGKSCLGHLALENNCISSPVWNSLTEALMLNSQPKKLREIVPLMTANNARCTRVVLEGCSCDDTSARVLLQSLRNNTSVTFMSVSNNCITDDGAQYLAEILENCLNLRKCMIEFNSIGVSGAQRILIAMDENRKRNGNLELVSLKHQTPNLPTIILQNLELMGECLTHPRDLKSNMLQLLTDSTAINRIALCKDANRQVSDGTVDLLRRSLEHNTQISEVSVAGNGGYITSKSITTIFMCGRLKAIDISFCKLTDEDVMDAMKEGLTSSTCVLENLNMSGNFLSDLICGAITDVIYDDKVGNTTLVTCNVSENKSISEAAEEQAQFCCDLNKHKGKYKNLLVKVGKNDPSITEVNLTSLEKFLEGGTSHVFKREYDDLSLKLLCQSLLQNTNVKKVIFTGNRVTDVGAKYLASLIEVSDVLVHIDVGYNHIGETGIRSIATALRKNSSVRVFAYDGNECNSVNLQRSIVSSLQTNAAKGQTAYSAAGLLKEKVSSQGNGNSMLQAAYVDKLVDNAIFDDAMMDFKRYHRTQESLD